MFNYREEKKKFDEEWKVLETQYREAGMSEQSIAKMREFDLEVFRNKRNELNHRAEISLSEGLESGINIEQFLYTNGHYIKFESNLFEGKYGWLNDIEDEQLLKRIEKLSTDDLELLTMAVFYELTQNRISQLYGISQKNICKKITRIKNFLI